jgi:adenine-specific DNA-methyltransferase
MRQLKYRLADHNIKVSTGRVVAFRAKEYLSSTLQDNHVPLIWGDNIHPFAIDWPNANCKKQQMIAKEAGRLLVPAGNYVIQRRFSTKEDKRRLVCAPLYKDSFSYSLLGFENKINFYYRVATPLTTAEVNGLSMLLNSAIYDRYFRLINGNINVSATEMQLLPMPSLEVIRELGRAYNDFLHSTHSRKSFVEEMIFGEQNSAVVV